MIVAVVTGLIRLYILFPKFRPSGVSIKFCGNCTKKQKWRDDRRSGNWNLSKFRFARKKSYFSGLQRDSNVCPKHKLFSTSYVMCNLLSWHDSVNFLWSSIHLLLNSKERYFMWLCLWLKVRLGGSLPFSNEHM